MVDTPRIRKLLRLVTGFISILFFINLITHLFNIVYNLLFFVRKNFI